MRSVTKVLAVFLALATLLSLAACAGKSAVVGSWESVEEPGTVYTFSEDGTGSAGTGDFSLAFSFVEKGNTLEVTFDAVDTLLVFDCAVDGEKLTLTDQKSGIVFSFTKK